MNKLLIFFICLGSGIAVINYTKYIVDISGKSQWAEEKFPGGTYSMWKFIGLLVILFGFLYALGTFD